MDRVFENILRDHAEKHTETRRKGSQRWHWIFKRGMWRRRYLVAMMMCVIWTHGAAFFSGRGPFALLSKLMRSARQDGVLTLRAMHGGHLEDKNFCPRQFTTFISASRARVYAISDLHADYAPNMEWVKNMESQKIVGAGRGDGNGAGDVSVLLLAGDLASDLSTLEEGLKYLKDKYDHVLFVPGNHELWCQRGDGAPKAPDSIVKLQDIMDICARCNVHTKPLILEILCSLNNGTKQGRVLLLPFLSWYHADFDTEPDLPPSVLEQVSIPGMRPFQERWADFRLCSWPEDIAPKSAGWNSLDSHSRHIAEAFAAMNEESWLPEIAALPLTGADRVISMSHFVPRLELVQILTQKVLLVPEKRFLVSPELPKVVGSTVLEEQIRRVGSHFHIFGHTHLPMDLEIDGLRYLQWSLGMQRKGKDARSCKLVYETGPLLLFDSASGGWCEGVSTLWGDYYKKNRRDASQTQLAPWVTAFAEDARRRIEKRRESQATSGDERFDRFEASQDEAKEFITQGDTKSEAVGAATGDSQEYIGGDVTQQIEKQRKWLEL